MIPAGALADYLQSTAYIRTLSVNELRKLWRTVNTTDMKHEYPRLFAAVREIVRAYGEISAVMAADFYDAVMEASGLSSKPAALAGVAADGQIKAMVDAALCPLWEETPRPDAAMRRMAGGVTRLSLQPGRETMYQSVKRDRKKYAVVPQGKTCSFCLMLASRGAVYTSKQPRWHDNCDCACVPVPADDDLPEINRTLQEEWHTATSGQRDQMAAWNKYVADIYGTT
jgi:hypothetical protein